MAACEGRRWNGRFTEVTLVRYINDVLLRSGADTLSVHWFDITVVNAKTGAQLYHNSCITKHRLTVDNGVAVAQSGRGRWKIANENNNVLKTKGYYLEHNFGHGKQYLAAFMLSLNLLAFLFHTVLEWSDDKYALLRRVLARRRRSCTPNLRLIRQHEIRVEYPSFTTCGRGLCHGLRSLFLPAGADRPRVAMRHAPVGMAQRHRRVPAATGAPTPTAQAPS
jgi:hypothetical protein